MNDGVKMMHLEKKLMKPILTILLTSLLLITVLPLSEVGGAVAFDDGGEGVDVDPLVAAGYRPRYPYEGSPFIQTPSPAPEGVEMVTYGDDDEVQGLSSSPTRRTYELYYSYSILEAYVDTDAGDLSSSEWDLLKRFCDDFVNISYGRSKDYFDPLDKVDDVVFYVYNIDGQSGIGGYYQPGTHHFFVDRADLNWAGVIITHEFQHYIHRQYDPYEYLWIDEGFADLSAYLTYGLDSVVGQHAVYYLKYYPTVSLIISDNTFQSNVVYYGSSFMYALYMMEHYGGRNYTRALVRASQRGTSGVNSALTTLGFSDRFDSTFQKWKVATRVNDDHAGEDKEFAYEVKTFSGYSLATNLQASYNGLQLSRSGNLNSYGVVSLRFSSPPDPNEEYRLRITIPSGTPDVALYEESSAPRSVRMLSFSGDTVKYDLTEWGTKFDTFQLILSSSQSSEYSLSLDILDLDPPITEAFIQPGSPDGEDGWYVNSPKITLTTEAGATKFYQFNSGDIMEYSGPVYVPEGIYNVSYWSEDTRDNVEKKRYFQLKVDLSTPRSSIDIDPELDEGEWYTSPPNVFLYTTHLYSDIFYTWGNRDFTIYTEPLTAPEGTSSIVWYAIDQAGNREMMREREFMVDSTAPEVLVNVYPAEPDGEGGWYVSLPRITLSTEDNADIYYSLDGGSTLLYDLPLDIMPGDHEVRITAHDQAGNSAPELRYQFRVDTGSPTLFGHFDKFQYSVENSSRWLSILPTLTLWSDENNVDITYTVNGGEPLDHKGDITIGQGESEIIVYGKDRAGNSADPLHFRVLIDSLRPKVEHQIDDVPIDGWYRSSEVEISLVDVSSGSVGSPVSISYSWDYEEWTLYRSPIAVREGIHVLQYSAVDSAGNAMDPRTIDLKMDSVQPTGHISVMWLLDNSTVEVQDNITFDMTSSLDTGGIAFYRMDFGDGETTSWSGYGEFVHGFDEAGTYTVTGWVKDHAGNEQSKTVEVTVWKGAEDVAQEQQGSEIPLMALLGGLFILVLLVFFLIQVAVIMKRRNQPRMPNGHHGRSHLPHRPADQLLPPHAGGVENGGQDQIGHVVQGDVIPLPEHLQN